MVNEALTAGARTALRHVPAERRQAVATLFALDARLGAIVRAAREPLVGQMRLAWWRDALARLDTAPAPAEPLLRALAAQVLPAGVSGAVLAGFVDGWEHLVGGVPDEAMIARYAAERGTALFAAAATLLGGPAVPPQAGVAWALADLPRHAAVAPASVAAAARAAAADALATRWSRSVRPLGVMMSLALADIEEDRSTGLRMKRMLSLLRFSLVGR